MRTPVAVRTSRGSILASQCRAVSQFRDTPVKACARRRPARLLARGRATRVLVGFSACARGAPRVAFAGWWPSAPALDGPLTQVNRARRLGGTLAVSAALRAVVDSLDRRDVAVLLQARARASGSRSRPERPCRSSCHRLITVAPSTSLNGKCGVRSAASTKRPPSCRTAPSYAPRIGASAPTPCCWPGGAASAWVR